MRVLVTGGRGTLGRRLVALCPAVHELRTTGRTRPSDPAAAATWVRSDLATGEGLAEAVDGIDAIIHAASSPRKDTEETDVHGTRRLLEAAKAAGVAHVVYVSIVGIDRAAGFPYYAQKLAAEGVVREGGVPYTILRASQFHDFLETMIGWTARLRFAPLPRGWQVQPVDVDEVARELWRCVDAGPRDAVPDLVGPELLTMDGAARTWAAARGLKTRIFTLPLPGSLSRAMRAGALTHPDVRGPGLTWADWLRRKYGRRD
ncbi:MAG TPA: NAD(P)H-binding protein [Longimicrobiaceae bacterium]|jgi:uncharacterized protein YbjT (DUF2867 family)|nr:NAD(P)H-binding protein [Longimicrobiaceae bacterium]